MTNPILDSLNPTQRKAAEILSGPLLILAGAGSGKTKTLTHRIANLIANGVNPREILAVTFTNKAAKEMTERVEKLLHNLSKDGLQSVSTKNPAKFSGKPMMGTFHSICVRMLREDIESLGRKLTRDFVIFDTDDQVKLLKEIMIDNDIDPKEFNPKAVAGIISSLKNKLRVPTSSNLNQHLSSSKFELRHSNNPIFEVIDEIFPEYQKRLEIHNALDFDDLIQKTVQVLEKSREIRKKYQNRWKHVLVDEYQDVNFAQYRLVRLLLGKEGNLCVIGDDHQSIYAFRGADFSNILNFSRDFPQAQVIKLEQNYRSTKNILANANSLISYNETGMPKKLWTDNETGEKLEITEVESDREEGNLIARKIREKMQQPPQSPRLAGGRQMNYSDFAVLYRMNAQSRSLEEAFMRHQIPYQIIGGTKFFSRKEIKDVIAYLRLVLNPKDDLSFLRVINFPSRKIGKSTIQVLKNFAENYGISFLEILEHVEEIDQLPAKKKEVLAKFRDLIQKSRENLETKQVSEILQEILDKTKLLEALDDGTAEGESRAQNVREIFSVTSRYDTADDSLAAFLEGVALIADVDNMENKNAVTLMTIHSSKGLEFPYVFLPGWEEGIFPSSRSLSKKEDLEEERRLGYVAITRAKKKCEILYTKKRLMFGQFNYPVPSPFLDELDEKCCERKNEHGRDAPPGRLYGKQNPAKKSFSSSSNLDHFSQNNKFELMGKTPKTREEALFGVAKNDTGYQTSDKISHATFGEGTVVMVNGDTLTVAFPGIGLKKISASIAPIEKLTP